MSCEAAYADQNLRPLYAAVPRTAEGDALEFGIYELAGFDSNLFRLPDDVEPRNGGKRSAVISTLGAGLHVDKRYGLQRILLDASLTRDRYSGYNNLDFTGLQINGTLAWSLTPSITGNINLAHSRYANAYEYVGFRTAPDPRMVDFDRLDVDWRAGAALHPRLSLIHSEATSKSNTFQLENSRTNAASAALVYTFRSTNTASVYLQRATGESTDTPTTTPLLDRRFTEREQGVRITIAPLGSLQGTAQVGYRQRDYDTFAVRNFEGWIAQTSLIYLASGKTLFIWNVNRNYSSSQTTTSSFYVTDYTDLTMVYSLTGKISLKPTIAYKRLMFDGAPIPSSFALKQNTRYANFEADWAASRAIDLNFVIGHSRRDSNLPSLQYTDHTISVLARLKF